MAEGERQPEQTNYFSSRYNVSKPLRMFVENLCSPAILYLGFALTQIVIDLFRKMYNTAIVKSAVAIVFTTVLNMLCSRGLTMISWFIVFIPFVTMTLVTGILLYVFGLAPFTGKLNYSQQHPANPPPSSPAVKRGAGPQPPAKPLAPSVPAKPLTPTQPATTPSSTPTETSASTSGELALRASGIGSRLGGITSGLSKGLGNIVGGVGSGVGQAVGGLGQGISDVSGSLSDGTSSAVEGVSHGIGSAVGGVGRGIGSVVSGLGSGLGSIGTGLSVAFA
jgi:hypothetical protein